ncbi:MAG: hypothetical protein SGI91_23405 [Alphaproteobacteria bacterium]|jgi:hypothetical protein|nr:hypothetical protein [Alphaproteobacteria bacterium]
MATTRNTRDTTRSDAVTAGLVSGAIAAALVVYAALYGAAAWSFAHAEARYRDVANGKAQTIVELDALTQALRASPARHDLSRAALVQILAAEQIGAASLRAISRLSVARRDLRLGLSATPTDAFAWTRLATTELRLGHRQRAAAALMVACHVGLTEPTLAATQFDLAVTLWPQLSADAKAAVERRLNWAQGHQDMAQDKAAATVRRYLASERGNP